jgi:hypothetical protein
MGWTVLEKETGFSSFINAMSFVNSTESNSECLTKN